MTVAVEQGLEPVKQYLESQGCECIDVKNATSSTAGATVMVLTGADENLMGITDVTTPIPIVTANGLTPEEVYNRVKQYLH